MNFENYLKNCPCGSSKYFKNCCKSKELNNIIQSPEDKIRNDRPDWRLAAITQLAKDVKPAYPGGPSFKKGAYVALTHHSKHPKYGLLGFATPHATALSLSIAVKNAVKASHTKEKLHLIDIPTPDGKGKEILPNNLFFDYLEYTMISINFSYQALETFCNSVIARTNFDKIQLDLNSTKDISSKKEIENNLSTEEKLSIILPKILEVRAPKISFQWQNFKKLNRIRNDIVHMKSNDMYDNVEKESNTLFYKLFNYPPLVFPKFSFELIWIYLQTPNESHHKPYWAQRFIDYFGKEVENFFIEESGKTEKR